MKITDYDAYLTAKKKVDRYEKYRKVMLWSVAPYMISAICRIVTKADWALYFFASSTAAFFVVTFMTHKLSMLKIEIGSFEWKYKLWQSEYNHTQDHLGICPRKIDY